MLLYERSSQTEDTDYSEETVKLTVHKMLTNLMQQVNKLMKYRHIVFANILITVILGITLLVVVFLNF